jgi:hypothetical protein
MQLRNSITPGRVWLDTTGNRIQAQGGSMLYVDRTYYWYGENKERSLPGSGIWHSSGSRIDQANSPIRTISKPRLRIFAKSRVQRLSGHCSG